MSGPRISDFTACLQGGKDLDRAIKQGLKIEIMPPRHSTVPGKMYCKVIGQHITVCGVPSCPRYPCKVG